MTAVLGALCGLCLLTGIYVAGLGVHRIERDESTALSTSLWKRLTNKWSRLPQRDRAWLVVGMASGPVAFVLTMWPVLLVVMPVCVVALPFLLRTPTNPEVLTLEALDRWIRALVSSIHTGKSLADAVRSTSRQAPALLAAPVRSLVIRLDDRWQARDAYRAFADDLDSADADVAIASMILAAERGGRGAATMLAELSDSLQNRLRALREVEAEREKPRIVVRQVATISMVLLVLIGAFSPGYFAPLKTFLGQCLVALSAFIFLGSLAVMRRRTAAPKRQRLLARHDTRGVSHARIG